MQAFAHHGPPHGGNHTDHHHGPAIPLPGNHGHHPGLTAKGANFAWFVYIVMLASALLVTVWGLRRPLGKRAFHWIGASLLFTAAISYYAMATATGVTYVPINLPRKHHNHGDVVVPAFRAVYYARYIDWTITTPLLLLELLLATGMPATEIFFAIMLDLFMIVGGLIGSVVGTDYRWGWFTGATVAMLVIFYFLLFPARQMAFRIGEDVGKPYTSSTIILLVLWTIYPIAWGLADGSYTITPDTEMILYGVLDILAKPVFLFVHLFSLQSVDYSRFGISGSSEGRITLPDDDEETTA